MEGVPKPKNNIEQKEEIKNLEGIDFVFSENPNIERMAIESVNGVDFSQLDEAEFVSLYRAEGKTVDRKKLPEASRGLAGTWFTTDRDVAETYLRNEDYSLYQIDVPKQFYEGVKLSGVGNVIANGECQLPLNLAEQKRLYLKDDEISKDDFKNFLIQYRNQHGEISLEKREEAKMVYGKYLETVFPESRVKDILYHSSKTNGVEEFSTTSQWTGSGNERFKIKQEISKGLYASRSLDYIKKDFEKNSSAENLYALRFNIHNPIVKNEIINSNDIEISEVEGLQREGFDGFISSEGGEKNTVIVFDPEQIYILGSQKDQEKFKDFIKKQG